MRPFVRNVYDKSMKSICRLVTTLLVSLGLALPASATTLTADFTGLWYRSPAESESGWGVNIIQQHDVLFVTMFIYDQANQPHWYVASNVVNTGGSNFSGQLFNIGSGTYFGAPWAGISGVQAVGNIAFQFSSPTQGSMTFSINNVQVTKPIVRQSWRIDNLTGNYIGGLTARGPGCDTGLLVNGDLTVTHSQPNISFRVDFVNASNQPGVCTFNGIYSQVGSVGAVNSGNFTCTINNVPNAFAGSFSMSETYNNRNGFAGAISGTSQFCSFNGYFGGTRDVF